MLSLQSILFFGWGGGRGGGEGGRGILGCFVIKFALDSTVISVGDIS